MPNNYITIADKLKSSGVELGSVDIHQLSEDLRTNGATVTGYTTSNDGETINLLYDNSEAFDGALERCGVSLPKKEIVEVVEGKKGRGRGRKIDKGEEAIADVSA
jgi:hypothetical protein